MDKQCKSRDELKVLAEKVIDLLRPESLPIWQVKEVLHLAGQQLDWVQLNEAVTKATAPPINDDPSYNWNFGTAPLIDQTR